MLGVLTKLKESTFKNNNQINSTVTTRRWVLSTEWTRTRPGTGLVYKWINDGLSWMVDVVPHNARVLYRINKDEGDEAMSVVSLSFSKRCYQCSFSEIFKGRQVILEPCRNLKHPIRWLLWRHETLPGAIWKNKQLYGVQKELLMLLHNYFCSTNLKFVLFFLIGFS